MWMASTNTFPTCTAVADKTVVERNLDNVNARIAKVQGRLADKNDQIMASNKKFEEARERHERELRSISMWGGLYERRLNRLKQEQASYRLLNDIRLGKIIPVIAETGTVADVTFS